jgi:hypothetical protein
MVRRLISRANDVARRVLFVCMYLCLTVILVCALVTGVCHYVGVQLANADQLQCIDVGFGKVSARLLLGYKQVTMSPSWRSVPGEMLLGGPTRRDFECLGFSYSDRFLFRRIPYVTPEGWISALNIPTWFVAFVLLLCIATLTVVHARKRIASVRGFPVTIVPEQN